ncbi:hypothetical protein [Sphingomonas sp. Y38-1Y]|uniref:hypothetical protein n=1 Tax=Sphingomonas sp. Y38-1Y TaxID=3078265 RepID=UPI0028ED6A4A|nr:hypothetical protein [Sphingomonas sp. Y38-1Y]
MRRGRFEPIEDLDAAARERGLHILVLEAAFSGGTAALTSGVVLNAFALHLGASAAMIGLLASIPFLAQLLQLPAIGLVERWRARKKIAVVTSLIGRAMLALMALTAFWGGAIALWTFIAAQVVLAAFGAVGSCAWNSWIRDLALPGGRGLGSRSTWHVATLTASVCSCHVNLTAPRPLISA